MTWINASLVALLLACCFSAVGERLLSRISKSVVEWSQSILVGLAVTSIAFVPMSLLLPSQALTVTLVLLALTGVASVPRWLSAWWTSPILNRIEKVKPGVGALAFLTIIAWQFIQFSVLNARLSHQWDGYQIWATKALLLFHQGSLGKEWVSPTEHQRLVSYPHLVPLYEALVMKARGSFDWESTKVVFVVFYFTLLASTVHAAHSFVSKTVALAVTACVVLLQPLSARWSVGGYADMPQAAFAAGTLAAIVSVDAKAGAGFRNPTPWLIGGLVFVKSEGLILAAVMSAAALYCIWRMPGRTVPKLSLYKGGMLVVATAFLVRWRTLAWFNTLDLTYGPLDREHLWRASQHLLTVPRYALRQMLNISDWGLFWPLFLVSALVLLWNGRRSERVLTAGVLVALTAYTSIYYFTNWDIGEHMENSYGRLLSHIAPIAAVVIGVAYSKLRGEQDDSNQPIPPG